MTPPMNNSSIRSQQQPMQYNPCSSPVTPEPVTLGRKWLVRKSTGAGPDARASLNDHSRVAARTETGSTMPAC